MKKERLKVDISIDTDSFIYGEGYIKNSLLYIYVRYTIDYYLQLKFFGRIKIKRDVTEVNKNWIIPLSNIQSIEILK